MPALNFNILDGQLGQLPASIANAVAARWRLRQRHGQHRVRTR